MFFEDTGPQCEGIVEGLQGGMQARVVNPSSIQHYEFAPTFAFQRRGVLVHNDARPIPSV